MIAHRSFLPLIAALLSLLTIRTDAQDGWPAEFKAEGHEVRVFAPQPERIDGHRFTARSAVSLRRPGDKNPVFGSIWGDGVLEFDRGSRLGKLVRFTVTDARFPDMEEAERGRIATLISGEMPRHAPPIAIDWLVAAQETEEQGFVSYLNDPPEIIYQEKPGVLLFIDGEPIYAPVEEETDARYDDPNYVTPRPGSVERVVNTPFLLLRRAGGDHFLYGSGMWFRSSAVKGPWVRDHRPPQDLRSLVQRVDSGAALATTDADGASVVPEIVVRTAPAVLLDMDGPPQWRPLDNTGLLYASNTNKDLFLDVGTQEQYLLASGRWYATRDPARGPWRFVAADQLPADFARIPEGSAKDGALAHVSGTFAAREAVRDAQIPQTARVDRKNSAFTVNYDGDPWFDPIPGTEVELAINASVTVLRIRGHYHALDNAVWYDGPTPNGPWSVSTDVPAEVGTIPPDSPAYNTRYVQIYDHTPEVVYVGYTPGYLGSFVQGGVLIYGTGFYYRPWPGFWRPRPFTWGFNMFYDPWIGWGYGGGWGWNWWYPGWHGWGWGPYRPWGWGWGWCGPYGYFPPVIHTHHHYYGHRPSVNSPGGAGRQADATATGGRSQTMDLYAGREAQGIQTTAISRNGAGAPKPGDPRPAVPGQDSRPQPKPFAGDHFSDRDGNVFRQFGDRIERYEAGRWQRIPQTSAGAGTRPEARPGTPPPVARPAQPSPSHRPNPGEIRQDRVRGTQRIQDFQRYQQRPVDPSPRMSRPSGPSRSPAASPAPSRSPSAPSRSPSAPSRGGGGRR